MCGFLVLSVQRDVAGACRTLVGYCQRFGICLLGLWLVAWCFAVSLFMLLVTRLRSCMATLSPSLLLIALLWDCLRNQSIKCLREGFKKKNHWICDHDHTSPDPPPSFLETVIALGYFFSRSFLIIWIVRYILKLILVNFWVRFEQNNANGEHNSFQQIRGERRDNIQAQIC